MTDINMIFYVSFYSPYFFYIRFLYFDNVLHRTDGCILWCECALIRWMKEVIITFVHMNINISCFFFLFRLSWSLFLALIIIHTRSFFLIARFVVTRNSFVDGFKFLPIHWGDSRFDFFFVDESNYFIDVQLKYFST